MDLIPYVARIQRDLVTAAPGDADGPLAERLAGSVEASLRLALLDALVEAAAEVSATLGPGAVEVRLRGHEIGFAVTPPDGAAMAASTAPAPVEDPAPTSEPEADDGGTARLSLRMPERLKPKVEQAAEAAGLSVNAWLVRAIGSVVDAPPAGTAAAAPPIAPTWSGGQRHTGWAR